MDGGADSQYRWRLKDLRLIRHLVIRDTLLDTHLRMTENPRPIQRFAMFAYRPERTIWTSILPAISFVRSSALYAFASKKFTNIFKVHEYGGVTPIFAGIAFCIRRAQLLGVQGGQPLRQEKIYPSSSARRRSSGRSGRSRSLQ